MQLFFKKNIFFFFWIIAAVDIFAAGSENYHLHIALKPLLMPLLIAAVLLNTNPSRNRSVFITGLLFAFLGDVLLLANDRHPLFFIFGLVCFLITHVSYTYYFLQIKKQTASLLKQKPYLIAFVLLYTAALLYFLVPVLGEMKLPVIFYALVLSLMVLSSFHAYNGAGSPSGILFVTGAIFFIISDTLLAVDKFHTALPYAGFSIMLTYCLAQFFIVLGLIKHK